MSGPFEVALNPEQAPEIRRLLGTLGQSVASHLANCFACVGVLVGT